VSNPRNRDQRHGDLAAQFSGLSRENALNYLTSREVVLDWPERIEALAGGRALVRTAANLIVRFCPRLRLVPRSTFADDLKALLVAIDHEAEPYAEPGSGPVRVHIGGGPTTADVTGSADSWLAYVSGCGEQLPELVDSPNVLGAHAAAAFVTSETFKHALPLREEYAWHAPKTVYSVYEYGEPTEGAPNLGPVRMDPAPLLAGAGAVGQACVDVLLSTATTGELRVVDRGRVDDETNLNRSVLAVEADLEAISAKVELIERRADRSGLRILPHKGELAEVIRAVEAGEIPWPSVVASALDNADARRELQGLWPDFLFEGATGDTMAQVFRHALEEGRACLRCLHDVSNGSVNYEELMSTRTGMTAADIARALQDTSITLSKQAVAAAPAEVKAIATAYEGRDVCGYLREVERYFAIKTNEPVLLSVSFVSYLAGVFLAAELLKHFAGLSTLLSSRYQIDPVVNLNPERPFPQNREPHCYCVQRSETIAQYRLLMRKRTDQA
jgi:hypothetical protein